MGAPSRQSCPSIVRNVAVGASMFLMASAASANSTLGAWSQVYPWVDWGIHLHVMPSGKVVTWSHNPNDGNAAGSSPAYVVDIPPNGAPPATSTAVKVPNLRTNLFCTGHAFLHDGRLIALGGHKGVNGLGDDATNVLEERSNGSYVWHQMTKMSEGRWYPTALPLPNGEVLVMGGSITPEPNLTMNTIAEVWQPSTGSWRRLTNAPWEVPMYPFLHVAPSGKVFIAGPQPETRFLDTAGAGSWQTDSRVFWRSSGVRDYGGSVAYEPGKILVVGGSEAPLASAEVINLNDAAPAWRPTGSMASPRRHHNTTLLPDGKVLVMGGTSSPGWNNVCGAAFAAEQWDPATGQWTTLARDPSQIRRGYHSTAVLLRDARVLMVGGGLPAADACPDARAETTAEIFSPPYLFQGQRPTLSSAPASVKYGQTFFLGTSNPNKIARVTWVRLSTVTHALNMGQLFMSQGFTRASQGVNTTAPSSANAAPPGHYMVFVLSDQGVPSIAKVVQLLPSSLLPGNVALSTNDAVASASSTHSSAYPVEAVNNGDRRGSGWGQGGGWNDATVNAYPDWVQIDFNAVKRIGEIDVVTLQDDYANPQEPTETMTFTLYGITAFDVQYWNGSAWITVPGGAVTGNNRVWRRFTFPTVDTSRIRVVVKDALNGHSRITEIEAYTAP